MRCLLQNVLKDVSGRFPGRGSGAVLLRSAVAEEWFYQRPLLTIKL